MTPWRISRGPASGITQIPVQSPAGREACTLLHSRAKALSAQRGADSFLHRCCRGSPWTFVCFEGSIFVHPQRAFTGPIYRRRSFWSWRGIFRFHFHISCAHPQSSPPPVTTHANQRYLWLWTPVGKIGGYYVILWLLGKKKLSVCPGCFSLYTHMCLESLLGIWNKNEKSFMDLVC